MLSIGAFNALLKTLGGNRLSMCCSFWRPQSCIRYPQPSCRAASGLISDASVRRIFAPPASMWRGARASDLTGAARLIARSADGAMRDALSMLDRGRGGRGG